MSNGKVKRIKEIPEANIANISFLHSNHLNYKMLQKELQVELQKKLFGNI